MKLFERKFRLFEGNDPGVGGGGNPNPDPKPVSEDPKPVSFTVEQIKQMEAHKAEIKADYEKRLKEQELTVRETVLKEQEQKKDEESKASLLSKISEDESLKGKFENYKLNPAEMSNKDLSTHIDIFSDVIKKNTAGPEGEKIDTTPIPFDKVVNDVEKRMKERLNGGK